MDQNYIFGDYTAYKLVETTYYTPLITIVEKAQVRYIVTIFSVSGAEDLCQISTFDLRNFVELPMYPFLCKDTSQVKMYLNEQRSQLVLSTQTAFKYSWSNDDMVYTQIYSYFLDCSAGEYRDTSLGVCVKAPPGYYTPVDGYFQPVSCPIKTFTSDPGSSACLNCIPGTFNNKTAQSSCVLCDQGTFSSGLSLSCNLCQVGTKSVPDRSTCQNCDVGTFCNKTGCFECEKCPLGLVAEGQASIRCVPCNAGFSPNSNATACVSCASGKTASPGQEQCVDCNPGTYSLQGFSQCLSCDRGYYAKNNGSDHCDECPPGTYAPNLGSVSCTECSPGSFSPPGNISRSQCTPCPSGYFIDQYNSSFCEPCGRGTFTSDQGSTSCKKCDSNSFQNETGTVACKSCQPFSSSAETDATFCICEDGYYNSTRDGPCKPCPNGAMCLSGQIVVSNGYWSSSSQSDILYPCPFIGSCKGGVNSDCEDGYSGVLCAVCDKGYGNKQGKCVKCNPSYSAGSWFALLVIFLLFLFLMVQRPSTDHGIFSKVKILVSFLQVISQSNSSYGTSWPIPFISMVNIFSVVNVDIMKMTSLDCILGRHIDFYQGYLFQVLIPFFLCIFIAFLFLIWMYLNKKYVLPQLFRFDNNETLVDMLIRNELFILILLYPGVSTKILALFNCKSINGTSYLEQDYTILCHSSRWYSYLVGTIIMIVFWLVGVPLIFFITLTHNKAKLRRQTILLRFGFLYLYYKDRFYYWEIVELLRRLFLTAIIVLIDRGSQTQFVVSLLVSFVACLAQVILLPFEDKNDNWIQLTSLLGIYFTLYYGAFKTNIEDKFTTFLLILVNVLSIAVSIVYIFLILFKRGAIIYKDYRRRRTITKKRKPQKSKKMNTTLSPTETESAKPFVFL
eukprot:TRINITY_DN6123_c0_g1_i3.p1 TRINITY_DN6123_c0_g1~~TRINITY_DN6123_c0_g1_i3.p1  ORF type:complete len:898 (-),score=136.84 TRINITY_DN6123_c0_g1_i3:76-2769(-)